MSKTLTGSCGCGAVQYEISGPVKLVVNCHCNTCRKMNGAAYSTYGVIARDALAIQQGQESIATYQVSENAQKQFCSICGSPLYNVGNRYPGLCMVHYGSLSGSHSLTPAFNIYCESKLPWVDGIASIKSFDQAIER